MRIQADAHRKQGKSRMNSYVSFAADPQGASFSDEVVGLSPLPPASAPQVEAGVYFDSSLLIGKAVPSFELNSTQISS